MGAFDRIRGLFATPRDDPRGGPSRVDQIAPWLLIGPELLHGQYEDLVDRGVTHVVDLREEGTDDPAVLGMLGIAWLRVPVQDRRAPTHEQLAEIIEWLDSDADPNVDQAVYIHCQAGLGRTPTVAIALLMQHELSLGEAHRMVLSARPEAAPTTQQLTWLEEVEARLRAERD